MARQPEVKKNIMTEQELAELHRRLSLLSPFHVGVTHRSHSRLAYGAARVGCGTRRACRGRVARSCGPGGQYTRTRILRKSRRGAVRIPLPVLRGAVKRRRRENGTWS